MVQILRRASSQKNKLYRLLKNHCLLSFQENFRVRLKCGKTDINSISGGRNRVNIADGGLFQLRIKYGRVSYLMTGHQPEMLTLLLSLLSLTLRSDFQLLQSLSFNC